MREDTNILIVGAGAAGLLCAVELAKQGKKITILEARNRIGGRIWEIDEDGFGFPLHAGAEFTHGKARITNTIAKEAGLTVIPLNVELLFAINGTMKTSEGTEPYREILREKLEQLTEDVAIDHFLATYFSEKKYNDLRAYVTTMVQQYDAANPERMSTFSLRDEWLGQGEWEQGHLVGGYGGLLRFLQSQCDTYGITIHLEQEVTKVELTATGVKIACRGGEAYEARQAVITVPLPKIQDIAFEPAIPEKVEAASRIGFGGVIKVHLLFKDRWWLHALDTDPKKKFFVTSQEAIATWWSQFPDEVPLLTGWVAGPKAEQIKHLPASEIIDRALTSLEHIFGVKTQELQEQLVAARVTNWLQDRFAYGAYSYPTPETEAAFKKLIQPVDNKIFFAGEALYRGQETATVEGALASGRETAETILKT